MARWWSSVAFDCPADVVEHLAEVGVHHTSTPDVAWFCAWNGSGWATSTGVYSVEGAPGRGAGADEIRRLAAGEDRRNRILADELADLPQLSLTYRGYYVLTAPVLDVTLATAPVPQASRLVPDLWWPDDRAWFVASDTDLTWTYVGGTSRFVDALADVLGDRATEADIEGPIR